MARITVEDCIDKFPSRFELVLVASNRARKLHTGEDPTVEIDNESNKTTILSSNEYLSTEIIFRIEILEISLIFINPENSNIVIINEANIPREAMSEDLNLLPNIRSDKSIIRENPTINNSGVISKISFRLITLKTPHQYLY